MTISNIGFSGEVPDTSWSRLARLLGESPSIERNGDLPLSQVAGARQLILGLGAGARSGFYADGVLTSLSATETMDPLTPTNGQWFLAVATRSWQTRTTVLQYRNGPVTATGSAGTPPTAVPTDFPASFVSNPGVSADAPIAWVWATSASTALSIVPLMTPPDGTYPQRGTMAQRAAYFASCTPINAGVAGSAKFAELAGFWFNTESGTYDRYFGTFNTINPVGAIVADWYPVSGNMPLGRVELGGSKTTGTGYGTATQRAAATLQGGIYAPTQTAGFGEFVARVAGYYEVTANNNWQGNTTGNRGISISKNGERLHSISESFGRPQHSGATSTLVYLAVGERVGAVFYQDSGSTLAYNGRFTARYIGPASKVDAADD